MFDFIPYEAIGIIVCFITAVVAATCGVVGLYAWITLPFTLGDDIIDLENYTEEQKNRLNDMDNKIQNLYLSIQTMESRVQKSLKKKGKQ